MLLPPGYPAHASNPSLNANNVRSGCPYPSHPATSARAKYFCQLTRSCRACKWTSLDAGAGLRSARIQKGRSSSARNNRGRKLETQCWSSFFLFLTLVETPTPSSLWRSSSHFIQGSPHMDDNSENPTAQNSAITAPTTRVLRLKEVPRVTGLGRSYIYQLQAERQFPHSIKIGVRAVGWLEDEVQAWIEHRSRVSRHKS